MSKHTTKIQRYTLVNKNNMQVIICNFGARILSIKVPKQNGDLVETTYNHTEDKAILRDESYMGATCGRVANRISNASYFCNNTQYLLDANEGNNTLHGGSHNFSFRFWEDVNANSRQADEACHNSTITLSLISEDGDQGFPGRLNISVSYTLDDDNTLSIKYHATCDKLCPINICNHTYFNLGEDTINDLSLLVHAKRYLPVDKHNIPTGEIAMANGAFDFSQKAKLKEKLEFRDFDDCYVLNNHNAQATPICTLSSTLNNLHLNIFSNQVGLQIYTGNHLSNKYAAIALEAQSLVDAVNQTGFQCDWVGPSQSYRKYVKYQFCHGT